MPRYLNLSLAFCVAASCAAAQSVTTTPVGVVRHTLQAGSNLVSAPLLPAIVHQAVPSSLTATTFVFPASSFTSGAFNAANGHPTHYIEVVSGDEAGLAFDIASNTTDTITISGSTTGLGLTGTETITIRPHVTLGTLFADSSVLSAFEDIITRYPVSGVSEAYGWNGTNWRKLGSSGSSNHVTIVPGEGFVFYTESPKAVSFVGAVKTSPTKFFLAPNNRPNLIGTTHPAAGRTFSQIGLADALTPYNDVITSYATNNKILQSTGSYVYTGTGFRQLGVGSADNFIVPVAEAIVINLSGTNGSVLTTVSIQVD